MSIKEIASISIDHLEIWKDVVGYEGYYKISDWGRVISLGWIKNKLGELAQRREPRLLKTPENGRYKAVSLTKRGENSDNGKIFSVHRLVLEAFVGPCPPGMECRHLDGNPSNSHLRNICWGTPSENGMDKRRHGTSRKGKPSNQRGEKHGCAKLTEEQVLEMRTLWSDHGWDAKDLQKKYNIKVVPEILAGKIWKDSYKVWIESHGPVKRKDFNCCVGEKKWCAKMTEEKVLEMRRLWATGEWTIAQLNEKFGSKSANGIVYGQTWKHLLPKN